MGDFERLNSEVPTASYDAAVRCCQSRISILMIANDSPRLWPGISLALYYRRGDQWPDQRSQRPVNGLAVKQWQDGRDNASAKHHAGSIMPESANRSQMNWQALLSFIKNRFYKYEKQILRFTEARTSVSARARLDRLDKPTKD